MMMSSGYDYYDRDVCACGCRTPVAYDGLEPRFASAACRARWVERLAIRPDAEVATVPVVLDVRPQDPPPSPEPVAVEEVAEVQSEFAQRVAVASEVEAVLQTASSGMSVRPSSRSVRKFLAGIVRKVR